MKYYFLAWRDQTLIVAKSSERVVTYNPKFILGLYDRNEVPFHFTLPNEDVEDYLGNDLAVPVMSQRLKVIFDEHKMGEQYSWLSVIVKTPNREETYYLPYFHVLPNVINREKSLYNGKSIVKPVFSKDLIKDFAFFPFPEENDRWRFTSSLYISESIKKEILKQKLSGIAFESVPIS